MIESVFERVEQYSDILKLDFSSAELAHLAEEHELSAEAVDAIALVLSIFPPRKRRRRSRRFSR